MIHSSPGSDVAADVLDRFLRYVQIDTQSREDSPTFPSTAKQLDLCRLLADELRAAGVHDVEMDGNGYVMATIPSTLPPGSSEPPVIGFLAHVDTSPELPGANVRPSVARFTGQDIVLPGDPTQVVTIQNSPELSACVGHDIVTGDGTTLLGADDKAGVAEVMAAAAWLAGHPEARHGKVRIAFTPDEEVGRGAERFDLARFGAAYAYTLDGATAGEVEGETFSADLAIVTVRGRNHHPGYAKGIMVNSVKLAARFLDLLPRDALAPETTAGREGYVHPYVIKGGVEETTIRILIRDFDDAGLREKETLLRRLVDQVMREEPRAAWHVEVREQYRNMKGVLDRCPRVLDYADEAVRRVGLEPRRSLIRGGTDGSRLSAMGLPTPNLFCGGQNHHSKREWVSVQDMAKAVETIVQLAAVWAERGEPSGAP